MSSSRFENHYARLGLPFDATPEEIRHAFFLAAKRAHPDAAETAGNTGEFLIIKEAYEVLIDATRRAAYDQTLQALDLSDGLKLGMTHSRSRLLKTSEPQLLYTMVQLDSVEGLKLEKPMVNATLVIDKSTSMKGERMNIVKATAQRILNQLEPGDVLSIVAFSDRAEVIIPPSRDIDRNKMNARVSLMQTGGGTEMFYGLQKGVEMVLRNHRSSTINHIILITDGHTYGDEEKCLELAEQIKSHGVTISALGIGQEWNERFLDKLAGKTGGSSMFVSDARDLKSFMELKFNALHKVYAENLRLKILNSDVGGHIRYVFRVKPEPNRLDTDGLIALGNLTKNESLVLLLEILIPSAAQKLGSVDVLECEIRYELPGREIPAARARFSIKLPVLQDDVPEPPPQEIIQAMSRLTMYRMQEQARMEIDNGDVRAATKRLKYLASQVEASGESGLASTILREADRLEQGHAHLGGLEKSIMYGTRSLVSNDVPDDQDAS